MQQNRRNFITRMSKLGVASFLPPVGGLTLGLGSQGKKIPEAHWSVQQFRDAGLAHFSYAIQVGKKIYLVDPGRDPQPYYSFAKERQAVIAGIIETHPHADFVSSHLEIYHASGAPVYVSKFMMPDYPFIPFNQDSRLELAPGIYFRGLDTPGHAPDGISVVLEAEGKDVAVFSGDSLLIGDVGRPDLREYSGNLASQREKLARQMYHTVWKKFAPLEDGVVLYPAHGAGSLCGKNMRNADASTIGEEKRSNPAFQPMSEQAFVDMLLKDLPPVPAYFPYDVFLNIKGAPKLESSLNKIPLEKDGFLPPAGALVIDAREEQAFKAAFLPGSYNLQDGTKFETWLGYIVAPGNSFYLTAPDRASLASLCRKIAKIGYESFIAGAFVYTGKNGAPFPLVEPGTVLTNPNDYTIIDVRTEKEARGAKLFDNALLIPVQELVARYREIPLNKPIVVHCASGYRSALGSSMLTRLLPQHTVYDLGPAVTKYLPHQ